MNKRLVLISISILIPLSSRARDLAVKMPLPEDLGPAVIDVSAYPEEQQKAYREIFIPYFKIHGGLARAVNWPIIELDAHLEEQERRDNPELFQDPAVAEVSRDGWKKLVHDLYLKPACCGFCPVLTMPKARALWRFLVYDSIQRKTGKRAAQWIAARRNLLARFQEKQLIVKETGK